MGLTAHNAFFICIYANMQEYIKIKSSRIHKIKSSENFHFTPYFKMSEQFEAIIKRDKSPLRETPTLHFISFLHKCKL